jgi:hypothetical protein
MELKQALRENLELLRESLDKVKTGDFKHIKIVFGILRILVINKGQNKALLLGLAQEHNITPMVYIDSPFGLKTLSLDKHLQDLYFASNTENIRLTNADFILKHSQQEGGAHEDWDLEKEVTFPNNGILIGGLPPKIRKAIILGEHTHKAGVELLGHLD